MARSCVSLPELRTIMIAESSERELRRKVVRYEAHSEVRRDDRSGRRHPLLRELSLSRHSGPPNAGSHALGGYRVDLTSYTRMYASTGS